MLIHLLKIVKRVVENYSFHKIFYIGFILTPIKYMSYAFSSDLLNFLKTFQFLKLTFLMHILAIGIRTTMYGMIYLDFASHKMWNINPPINIVSKKITSADKFFLFCTKTIKAHVKVTSSKAF